MVLSELVSCLCFFHPGTGSYWFFSAWPLATPRYWIIWFVAGNFVCMNSPIPKMNRMLTVVLIIAMGGLAVFRAALV